MSTGPRIPREVAVAAAMTLAREWRLGQDAVWCGSLRRGRTEVGDLDLVVPAAASAASDALFSVIDSTAEKPGELFGSLRRTLVVPVKGHRAGFLSAWYTLKLGDPHPPIQLQINRYTPENVGWQVVMRTGPSEFGVEFLKRWNKTWSIPLGQEASNRGHLRDAQGGIVPVPTEADAFRLCGMTYVKPEDRDEFVRRLGLHQEHLR